MYEIAKYVVVYFCFFLIIGLVSSGISSCIIAVIGWCRKKWKAHKNPASDGKSE